MPTEKSVREVAELEEDFKTSQLVIAANYRGLSVNQMQGIRRAVRQSNSQFKITKNTLARIAADNAGRPWLKELMGGPIGFLTTEGDPAAAAKVLVNYIDDNKIEMTIIGGALEAEMLTQDRVIALAKLPSKEVLLAMLLGGMNRPITSLVMVMNGPVRALAIVLQRISELGASTAQADEAAAAPTPEASAETEEAPAAEAGVPEVDGPATETTEAGPDADEQKTE
ncbi:MAG: 50S ribosomal protein L10 [Chloroflexi bacterium]|nr:50S ribosomal protein L10 [Chloroflexota bacterium]MDA1298260.1 50S ribosomal protein L10 [Chloroflexota bacterium]